MRLIFAFIILIFFLIGCKTTTAPFSFDSDKEQLHGKIRMVSQHEYEATNTTHNGIFNIQHTLVKFNHLGIKISEHSYDADTNTIAIWQYRYDSQNRLKEEKWMDKDSVIAYRTVYVYYDNGLIAKELHYGTKNVFEGSINYFYNIDGSSREKINYDKDSLMINKSVYYYLNNNSVNEAIYNQDRSLSSLVCYKINEQHKITNISEFDKEGNIDEITEYFYDLIGNVNAIHQIDPLELNTEKLDFKYEFDAKKNWIMKMELKNDVPLKITLREYVYY